MTRLRTWMAVGATVLLLGCKQGPWQAEKLTPQQVDGRMKAGETFVFADVRSEGSYRHEHIKDAVHLAYHDMSKAHPPTLPKDRWIVLYCT